MVNVLLKGDVQVARERLRRSLVASSSACGVCGKVTIDSIRTACAPVVSDVAVPAALFHRLAEAMAGAQSTFERTGGLHAAGLFDPDGRLLVLREDIGRHNAVDKVVGHMLLTRRLPLDRHILMVSGRASFEIMQKAWMARIPIVAAVSAPSSMAVADGARRRHDPGGIPAPRRLQRLRGRPSACGAARRSRCDAAVLPIARHRSLPRPSRAGGLTHAPGHPS